MSPVLKSLLLWSALFVVVLVGVRVAADRWPVNVVAATTDIPSGKVIESKDLRLKAVARQHASSALRTLAEGTSKTLKRDIAKDDVIRTEDLVVPHLAPMSAHRAFPLALDAASKVTTTMGFEPDDRVDLVVGHVSGPAELIGNVRVLASSDEMLVLELDDAATLGVQRALGRSRITITPAAL